jgi:hypothetical protein
MPGPLPKDPSIRQRRNKSSTHALLPATNGRHIHHPSLPKLAEGEEWHPMARKFWETIWESPMSSEFAHGDEPALFRLVILVNLFWKNPKENLDVAKEVRMMEREFGLTPLSRRRLEWTIAETEETQDRHEENRSKRAKRMIDGNFEDPRGVLNE